MEDDLLQICGTGNTLVIPAGNINDGERFLVKARTIKKMFELNEGLAIKMSQCLTIRITILLVTFVFLGICFLHCSIPYYYRWASSVPFLFIFKDFISIFVKGINHF